MNRRSFLCAVVIAGAQGAVSQAAAGTLEKGQESQGQSSESATRIAKAKAAAMAM